MSPLQTHPNIFQILRANLREKKLPKNPKEFERKLFLRGISFYYKLPKNSETIWLDIIKIYDNYNKQKFTPEKVKELNVLIKLAESILKLNNIFLLKKIYFRILKRNYLTNPDETFMRLIGFLYGIINFYNLNDLEFFLYGNYASNDLYRLYKKDLNDVIESNLRIKDAIDWLPSIQTLQNIELMVKRRLTLRNLNL